MNPFEKLRRAVEKVTLEYEIPQQLQNKNKESSEQVSENGDGEVRKTKSKSALNENWQKNEKINSAFLDQQTQYIQQINELTRKNERLTKSLAFAQSEKEQLIQQVCVLQKNCEVLQQKLNQIVETNDISSDKQRKYKQEIHRINNTIQMLGQQLNAQRAAKKSALNELNKCKQQYSQYQSKNTKKTSELQQKIKSLQQEINERAQMLQYNMKKNSQQRKQNKYALQKLKDQYENKIQQNYKTIFNLKDQVNNYKSSCDILSHKLDSVSAKADSYQSKHGALCDQFEHLEHKNNESNEQIRNLTQQIRHLRLQNENLNQKLRQEKENVKLKVVQIRDQTLQLQLQMYRRQCKDLLQQKAISQKLSSERAFEPSYQVINNRY